MDLLTEMIFKKDVFVHQTEIKRNNTKEFFVQLGDGEIVQFDIVKGHKGIEVSNILGQEDYQWKVEPLWSQLI